MQCVEYGRQVACQSDWTLPLWYALGASAVSVILFVLWKILIFPIYNVWASRKEGEAEYQHAINEQRIQVAEAQARLDGAQLNKQAAIVEAEAAAAQIEKIGKELTEHDLYLRWQWIRMMGERKGETIYVPTEANLPILEATRRKT